LPSATNTVYLWCTPVSHLDQLTAAVLHHAWWLVGWLVGWVTGRVSDL